MKKVFLAVILAVMLAVLCGCADMQRVRVTNQSVTVDNLVLAVRHGYRLADDFYEIVDTDAGYDIVVHIVKNGEGGRP